MSSLMQLCLTQGSQPSKEQFAKIMFPVKQVLGLAIGLVLGSMQITGLFGLFIYLVVSSAICFVYATKYLETDEDEIEQTSIFTESFGLGFGCFLLTWVVSYSLVNTRTN